MTQQTAPAPMSADELRSKIFKNANEDFMSLYEEICTTLRDEELSIFNSRYELGGKLHEMQNDEMTYGSKSVERMEVLIGKDRCVIYNALKFYERYTQEELKDLKKLRNQNNEPLMWTHVTHLLPIADKDKRHKLQQMCVDKCWSPTELLNYINSQKPVDDSKPPTKAGKPMARPSNVSNFLSAQHEALDMLIKRKAKVWDGIEKPGDTSFLQMLQQLPVTKLNESLFEDLTLLENKFQTASLVLGDMATKIQNEKLKLEQTKVKSTKPIRPFKDEDEEEDDQPVAKVTKPVAKLIAKPVTKQPASTPLVEMEDDPYVDEDDEPEPVSAPKSKVSKPVTSKVPANI